MINLMLVAVTVAVTPESETTFADTLDHYESEITALENGEDAFDYIICRADPRSGSVSPHLTFLSVEDLYPQLAAPLATIEATAPTYAYEDDVENLALLQAKVDERKGVTGCRYTLIPSPESASIIAERAAYYRDAMQGRVDPQRDMRDLVGGYLVSLSAVPEGDQVLAVNACLHRYPSAFDDAKIRPEIASSEPQQVHEAVDAFANQRSRFVMSRSLFDEDAIWTAAYDARVPPMSQGECESLLAPYIND